MKHFIFFVVIIFCFASCNNSNSTESSGKDSVSVNSSVTPPKTSAPTGTGGNQVDSARTNPTVPSGADSSH